MYFPEDSAVPISTDALLPLTLVVTVVPDRAIDSELIIVAESEWPSTLILILLDELERFTELAPELAGSPVIWMLPLALLRVIVPLENAPSKLRTLNSHGPMTFRYHGPIHGFE